MNINRNETEYNEVDLEIRRRQRELRMREMKRQKKKQELMRKIAIPLCMVAVGIVGMVAFSLKKSDKNAISNNTITQEQNADNVEINNENIILDYEQEQNQSLDKENKEAADILFCERLKLDNIDIVGKNVGILKNTVYEKNSSQIAKVIEEINRYKPLEAISTNLTKSFGGEVVSTNGVFIDVEEGKILAQKDSDMKMSPASMTKILTLLVAAENVTNLDDKFTITIDITDYSFVNDCSNTGFDVDEEVTVRDLMYGTILPSGADAAVGLAVYVAGSHEAFVDMMNEKLDELGLADTAHFTNCVGLYDEKHYCTMYDMAVIMKAAADNEICREIMSAKTYTTSSTPQHPEGITISNWFLRRIEDKDTHGEVLYAKTGFVAESGSCAASYARGNDGKEYICVTANSTSSWRCIYDQVELYQRFLK